MIETTAPRQLAALQVGDIATWQNAPVEILSVETSTGIATVRHLRKGHTFPAPFGDLCRPWPSRVAEYTALAARF